MVNSGFSRRKFLAGGLASLVGIRCNIPGTHIPLPTIGDLEAAGGPFMPRDPVFFQGSFSAVQSGFISGRNKDMVSSIEHPGIIRASIEDREPYFTETGLLQFDLSSVPTNIITTRANLILTAHDDSVSQLGVSRWLLKLQGVSRRSWGQNSLNYNNAPFNAPNQGDSNYGDWGYSFDEPPKPREKISLDLNYLFAGNPFLGENGWEDDEKMVDSWIRQPSKNYGIYLRAQNLEEMNGNLVRTFYRTEYNPVLEIEGSSQITA
jgi:hypothetical protein